MSDIDKLLEGFKEIGKALKDYDNELAEIADKCDNETKLAVTAWVFKNIVEHAQEGGSYRTLIYDRLGFGPEAYSPLYSAGGMTISNEFDIERMDLIKEKVREEKIEALKPIINMCDEPECFNDASCGWPSENGYRHTCFDHSKFKNGSVA